MSQSHQMTLFSAFYLPNGFPPTVFAGWLEQSTNRKRPFLLALGRGNKEPKVNSTFAL